MGDVPGFWMNETSGVLAPVVRAYLSGARLGERPVAVMRAYLRQWVARGFRGRKSTPYALMWEPSQRMRTWSAGSIAQWTPA